MPSKKKLKRKIKKLRYKKAIEKYWHKIARKDSNFWQKVVVKQDIELEKLEAEIAELKAPKFTMTASMNGEPMEIVGIDGDLCGVEMVSADDDE